jgi:hypothetical protein
MKGLPDHFGTEQDIINCIAVDPAGTKAMLVSLLDGRKGWFRAEDLEDGDTGVTDELHEVRVEPVDPDAGFMAGPDEPMKRVQYEKRDDTLSQLYRMGLTVEKVNEYIAECEEMIGG